MIYEPSDDSFMIKYCISDFVSEGKKVLDVGCGSGILAQEAIDCGAKVLACDINPDAVKFCKKMGIKTIQSDLFSNIPKGERFDLIIFNPPYLPKDELEDEESAVITSGGEKGNEILERFLVSAKNYLSEGGKLLFLASSLTPDVEKILVENDYKFEIIDKKDLFFEKLYVYVANQ
jgi:release factor glutamine methyltransferase